MNLLNQALDSAAQAVGNIEKAIIVIEDNRAGPPVMEDSVSLQAGGSSAGLGFGDIVDGAVSSVESTVMSAAQDAAGKMSGNNKTFYVQFNPSELTLSGFGGGMSTKTDYAEGTKDPKDLSKGITFERVGARIAMNVNLIFDKVDPQDAFMADKLNTSTTAMISGAAKAVKTAMGRKDHSVQTEVEGFMAAIRSVYTRRITFYWGRLCYEGVLNRIAARYTMFNVNGQPIRAIVALSLVCADENVSARSMGRWQQQYYEAFQGQSQSYVKAAQKAGNLLNFNL